MWSVVLTYSKFHLKPLVFLADPLELLNETFAIGCLPDDYRAVVILQGVA